MILRTALCLSLTLALGAGRPKPPARTAAPVLKADPTVPEPGSCGERVDPATGRGRAVGPLLEPRTDGQATLFSDGRVLVSGGTLKAGSTEWFDPATNRFTPGPAMTQARQGHRALLLKDGRLLLLGGTESPSPAEVLERGAPTFKTVPGCAFALSADAVELDEGRVFLVDGASGALFVWDGKHSPSAKGTLNRPRNFFRALRMKDGRVAILGGWPSDPSQQKGQRLRGRRPVQGPSLPVECFNPRWSTLSTWSALPRPRARHQATLLEDGRICLWGGVGQDPESTVNEVECLDPVKETVTQEGTLDLQGNPCPAWAMARDGQGLYLPERGQRLLACKDPLALAAAMPAGRLANGYLGPTLVPLQDGSVLVLGSAAYGLPVDRWDARTRQGTLLATLRAGVPGLGLLPDGRVLTLGAVVDLVDPRTGAMTPLGWREDLEALLHTVRLEPPGPGAPPFPRGQERQNPLVVALDKTHALVAEGFAQGVASGAVDVWDLKKKALTPGTPLKTRRARPSGLKLNDGSVLIWGEGQDQ